MMSMVVSRGAHEQPTRYVIESEPTLPTQALPLVCLAPSILFYLAPAHLTSRTTSDRSGV